MFSVICWIRVMYFNLEFCLYPFLFSKNKKTMRRWRVKLNGIWKADKKSDNWTAWPFKKTNWNMIFKKSTFWMIYIFEQRDFRFPLCSNFNQTNSQALFFKLVFFTCTHLVTLSKAETSGTLSENNLRCNYYHRILEKPKCHLITG